MNLRTLVLNSSYHPIDIVDWKEAIIMLYKGISEPITEWDEVDETYKALEYDKTVSNYNKKYVYKIPIVIRLLHNNVIPKRKKLRFSKINMLSRDECRCQYCGEKFDTNSKNLEIEHVIPQSRGGKTSFENCVTACRDCNSKKADKTPEEAGMKLINIPKTPNPVVLLQKKLGKKSVVNEAWKKYLKYNTEIL